MISKTVFVVGFVGILVIEANAAINPFKQSGRDDNYYCGNEFSCKYDFTSTIKHVMCKNGLKLSPKCLKKGAAYIPMANDIKELFLNEHNKRRSLVAQGKLGGVFSKKTAARMATLVWDDELEVISVARVLQCSIPAEPCIKTKRFSSPVQNFNCIRNVPVKIAVKESINEWFNEHNVITDLKWIQSFGRYVSPFTFASFAQVIWSKASAMGCGMVKTKSHYYITCTYDTGRMIGAPVYEFGQMGSKCHKGMNPKYPGLCRKYEFHFSYSESPVVNEWIKRGRNI